MPTNINEFFKGDNRDIDLLKLPNDTARRIQNMRVLDVDGKGLVMTNIGGTEYKFSLRRSFIPVGNCEYNGVGYIASVNPETGEGEIGCYPAPRALVEEDCTLSGWDINNKQYAPLFNFTGINPARDENSVSQAFRTTLFDFDCETQIDIFSREEYDGSVNLYFAQKGIPLRVYNNGFDEKGECTSVGRRYSNTSFPNAVNIMNEAEIHMNFSFQGLGSAGILRAGNWFFFARYATENFDRTSFNTETNAIQITTGQYSTEGIGHHGFIGGSETDKSVKLRIDDIDPTYTYLELGYMYVFNDEQEFGIIDKLYAIDPNQVTMDIEITGQEASFITGFEEIIKVKPKYDGATTHTQLENRYFAGNLFDTTDFDNDAVKEILEFSRNITCQFDDSHIIQHQASPSGVKYGIYNNENNIYNFTGHFRGESYAYAVVCVLNNGRETQAFPITASDDYSGPGGAPNNSGVYRFPNVNVSPTVTGNYVKIMGIKFDISNAIANIPQYVQDSVSGFYIVRAKRNETLMYQGLSLPCYNADKGNDPRGAFALFADRPQKLKRNEDIVPMFELDGDDDQGASFPYIHRFDPDPTFDQEFTLVGDRFKLTKRIPYRWGFFSPDHFFNKSLPISNAYCHRFADIQFNISTTADYAKTDYYYSPYSYSYVGYARRFNDVSNVKEWEPANNNGFTSYFNEGKETDFNSMFYFYAKTLLGGRYFEMRNEAIAWNSYIGIKSTDDFRYKLSNMYKTDITSGGFDIAELYDVKSTDYYRISKFYKLSDVVANPSLVNNEIFYKGDCFLQRTWLKQLFNPKYGPGVKEDGDLGGLANLFDGNLPFGLGAKSFSFGTMFDIITENKINTEMRLDTFTNKFYPGSSDDIKDIALKNIEKESQDLNRGYNEVLSIRGYKGIDEDIPFFPENKPSGIMYSNRHILGSFLDGYREIDLASLKEYDYRMGAIVSLKVLNNILISIQENGVNRHFVNEKAILNQGNAAGELLLGTGDVLDSKHHNLTDFVGTQHQWSIVVTDISIYGIDFNKRKHWRLLPNLQVEMISDSKGYRQKLHELCERTGTDSDITGDMLDNPVCRQGIVGHYDRKHNDVYFTWVNGDPTTNDDCSINRKMETIVFNEWLNAYHGSRTFGSPMYMNINEDFFSFNPAIFPSTDPSPSLLGDAWIHDILKINGVDNSTCFYGSDEPDISYVEFVVKDPSDMSKVFDNMFISSAPEDPYRIEYTTEDQIATHFPWIIGDEANFWRDPIYKENLWRIPIIRAEALTNAVNNIYDPESRFRGRYLKVRLEYKTKSGIFIKSVLTMLRQSHN